ncbi:MAG: hypothetical protein IPL12_16995 [Bacteroidetes bacterium]|nr:hypothetical protein [Bacteroidota bacterium]
MEQEGDAEGSVNDCNGAKFAVANSIAVKPAKEHLQHHLLHLHYNRSFYTNSDFVARTMMIAQKELYEEGHITYMRTD